MKPFIDNQRGATSEFAAYRAKVQTLKYGWFTAQTVWFVCVCLLLTACASPYNHPGIPRTPDPAYDNWLEEGQ